MGAKTKITLAILGTVVAIMIIVLAVTPTASAPVSGVVESVKVVQSIPHCTSYSSYDAWRAPHFVAVTVVANNGTTHYAALPEELGGASGIRSGDEITVTLGRTAFRTKLPFQPRIIKEKDGTFRVLEPTVVGWRLIKTYQIKSPKE
ncbi:MAG: hypothetical protein Q7S52_03630 [bacterium]|nr:hypothetical protein [bacterium]